MASGILLSSGQVFVVDAMKYYIDNVTSGLYVGLMTNTTKPAETDQLPSGIVELSYLTNSGYARQLSSSWPVTSGNNPYIQGSLVTFTPSGNWASVNGYFISETISGDDALWSELFPPADAGAHPSGVDILFTPRYIQKDSSE